jgi:hypothetical protein
VKRQQDLQAEWWAETITVVRERLARVDRGESSAPVQAVRCWRILVAPEVRR